jgi:hypothetical protein
MNSSSGNTNESKTFYSFLNQSVMEAYDFLGKPCYDLGECVDERAERKILSESLKVAMAYMADVNMTQEEWEFFKTYSEQCEESHIYMLDNCRTFDELKRVVEEKNTDDPFFEIYKHVLIDCGVDPVAWMSEREKKWNPSAALMAALNAIPETQTILDLSNHQLDDLTDDELITTVSAIPENIKDVMLGCAFSLEQLKVILPLLENRTSQQPSLKQLATLRILVTLDTEQKVTGDSNVYEGALKALCEKYGITVSVGPSVQTGGQESADPVVNWDNTNPSSQSKTVKDNFTTNEVLSPRHVRFEEGTKLFDGPREPDGDDSSMCSESKPVILKPKASKRVLEKVRLFTLLKEQIKKTKRNIGLIIKSSRGDFQKVSSDESPSPAQIMSELSEGDFNKIEAVISALNSSYDRIERYIYKGQRDDIKRYAYATDYLPKKRYCDCTRDITFYHHIKDVYTQACAIRQEPVPQAPAADVNPVTLFKSNRGGHG